MSRDSGQSIVKRLFRNTFSNVAGRIWLIASNLILTPLILSFLGQDRFAVWVLFGALTQYLLLLDWGLGTSLVKYVAQFQAKGDAQSINQAVTTILGLYLVGGGLLLAGLWPVIGWLTTYLALPASVVPEAVHTFRLGLVVIVVVSLVTLFDALLKGLQRMDLTNMIVVVMSVPNFLTTYVVLRLGGGLPALVVVNGLIYLLQLMLLVFFSARVFVPLRVGPSLFEFDMVKLLSGYGARYQVSRIAEAVSYHADKILLGLLLPIRYVAFYDLGAKVALILHDLPVSLFGAVFPAASELAEQKDRERLWLLCERGTKYLFIFSVPTLLGVWLNAHLILQVWLGYVETEVRQAVIVLATGYWVSISMGIVTTIGIGMGWMSPLMRAGILQCGLNLLLSLILILWLGYVGALIGTMLALMLSNGYVLVRFCRDFHRPLLRYVTMLWQIALLNMPAALLAWLYLLWADHWAANGGRGLALLAFLGCVILYVGVYLASIRWSGALDDRDWDLLGGQFPCLRYLRVGRP